MMKYLTINLGANIMLISVSYTHLFADNPFEGRQLIAVRIFGMVLLEQFSDCLLYTSNPGIIPFTIENRSDITSKKLNAQ